MTLAALVIAVTLQAGADYDDAVNRLRRLARAAGCETPVIERLVSKSQETVMVTCREVQYGRD